MRLTNDIKKQIADNAMAKAGFNDQFSALFDRCDQLARRVMVHAFGGQQALESVEQTVNQMRELWAQLPKSSFGRLGMGQPHIEMSYGFNASFGGMTVRLMAGGYFEKGHHDKELCNKRKETAFYAPPERPMFAAEHPLSIEYMALRRAYDTLLAKRTGAYKDVLAALAGCNTKNQLLKLWPEAEELLPVTLAPAKANLPAVQISDLNKLIGLPTGEAA